MSPVYRLPPGRGLISRLLSPVLLVAVLLLSLFLGLFVLLTVLGAGLVLALVLYARAWWLRRRLVPQPRPERRGGVTLEGEYTVSKPDRDEHR